MTENKRIALNVVATYGRSLCSFSVAFLAGLCLRSLFPPSFARIVLTALTVELALIPLVWLLVLKQAERTWLLKKLAHRFVSRSHA